MFELRITRHAIDRYRQRVADLSDHEICEHLQRPIIQQAAKFGAPYVRLGGGQRVVIEGNTIVTVLPVGHHISNIYTRGQHPTKPAGDPQ